MQKSFIFDPQLRKRAAWLLILLVVIVIAAEVFGHAVMTNWYSVQVSNVWIENQNGLMVRGKLYKPDMATPQNPAPGVVYLHGYQNNRETSDPYGIELARRGFVVIVLDTLGRGNSDNQFSEDEPGFDPTYGGDSAFAYLRALPYVDPDRCGMGGHSLGGEMSYTAAMQNDAVQAIVFSGFAYLEDATPQKPKNMLMIFGKYDEYRQRMTGTRDFEAEWMQTPQTKAAFGVENPQFNTTYGSFADGSARRVHMTHTTHVPESFDNGAIAEAVTWYSQALNPDVPLAIPATAQICRYKEIASLVALICGIFTAIPLSILLLGIPPFSKLASAPATQYARDRKTFRHVFLINGALTLLFLALVMVIFGLHVYVVPIDGVFPMMMVNGVVFWFVVVNIIGFFIFKRWLKKRRQLQPEVNFQELGISQREGRIRLSWDRVWRVLLLGILVFACVYALQAILERFLLIDYRYKFPYASDLTPYRLLMLLLYFPLFLIGFIQVNIMLQGQLRPKPGKTWLQTVLHKSIVGILVLISPFLINLAIQYIPLYLTGLVPFVGPGGALVGFVINLEHMIVLQILMVPIATVLYQATGSVYPGAVLNALLTTWMFVSSSVIAPLPI
jgi:dienelactone hydrolase